MVFGCVSVHHSDCTLVLVLNLTVLAAVHAPLLKQYHRSKIQHGAKFLPNALTGEDSAALCSVLPLVDGSFIATLYATHVNIDAFMENNTQHNASASENQCFKCQ